MFSTNNKWRTIPDELRGTLRAIQPVTLRKRASRLYPVGGAGMIGYSARSFRMRIQAVAYMANGPSLGMESRPIGIWMEAKIVKLRRNRKKEIFDIPLLVRQDFSKKSVLTEESGKNFSHPPTPFCAPEWAALIRPWSGGS